jgi:pyridoxal phosphate enzyme (YggS family)
MGASTPSAPFSNTLHDSEQSAMPIAQNVAQVRERIRVAANRAGRDATSVTLMAVSKTFPPASIREAYAAGVRVFGENRVQEFSSKTDSLRDLTDARWHMIGHLQSNKAGKAAELFDAVDSIDSLKLAERLSEAERNAGKTLPILIEINVGGEPAKTGIAPDSPELDRLLYEVPRFQNIQVRGLMTVPPYTEDPEGARPYFRRLRELRDQIAGRRLAGIGMDELSMGMSHDFEVAIEEGATCVRVGSAIFGSRVKA